VRTNTTSTALTAEIARDAKTEDLERVAIGFSLPVQQQALNAVIQQNAGVNAIENGSRMYD
jgi:hypothetical protein